MKTKSLVQIGTQSLRNLDPFLMLDELKCPATEAASGFPTHPHRGFETCSIMFNGKIEHNDSAGNKVRQHFLFALDYSIPSLEPRMQ